MTGPVTGSLPRLRPAVRDLRRAALRRRGLLAGGLTAAAVASGLSALAPGPGATVAVLSAARDLSGGSALRPDDVTVLRLPPAAVPSGTLPAGADVVGRVLAAPARHGEPLTDVRLLGPGLLAAVGPGLVAVPVRVADGAAAGLLRAGDHIDVLAAGAGGDPALAAPGPGDGPAEPATVTASDALVLAVPRPEDGGLAGPGGPGGSFGGALVVIAATPATAARLAGAAVASRLSLVVRPLR